MSILLMPEANQAMAAVIAATGESMTGLISRLLIKEARQVARTQ
jgi:hypothetical protein